MPVPVTLSVPHNKLASAATFVDVEVCTGSAEGRSYAGGWASSS